MFMTLNNQNTSQQKLWWAFGKNKKTSTILLGYLLLFCVLTYKGAIPYNEEILVALSFFTFVLFCLKYFSSTVQESLDERSAAIKGELQSFLQLKQESLRELHQEHKKIADLKIMLPNVQFFTQEQLLKYNWSGESRVMHALTQQFQVKLAQILSSKPAWQESSYKLICQSTQALVLTKIWSQKIQQRNKRCLYLESLKNVIGFIKV